MWSISDGAADVVERAPFGTVLRSPSLEDAWSVNAVRLEHAEPGLTLDDVAALARTHAGAPYVHVHVEDEPTALRLEAPARAAGWTVERHVLMRLTRPPSGGADPRVRAGTLDEVLALMREWLGTERHPPRTIEHLLRRIRREHAIVPE